MRCYQSKIKAQRQIGIEKYLNQLGLWKFKQGRVITALDNGSFVDSLKSAIRILVGSALAPAPVADSTFRPLHTHAARSATYYKWKYSLISFPDFAWSRKLLRTNWHRSNQNRVCKSGTVSAKHHNNQSAWTIKYDGCFHNFETFSKQTELNQIAQDH